MAKVTVNSKLPHYNILLEKVNDLKLTTGKNVDYTQVGREVKEIEVLKEKVEVIERDEELKDNGKTKVEEKGKYGKLEESKVLHNACIPLLYHHALRYEPHTELTSTGALSCLSGEKTGRSPLDKRTVCDDNSRDKVWWDSFNIPISSESFALNKSLAIDYINKNDRIYITDAFAGWDPLHRIKVRVVSIRAYHAIFMHNLLIEPTEEELKDFKPEFTIYNAGPCEAKQSIPGVTSNTSICINYTTMEMIILGSEYAGEMKKGILTLMMYLLPQKNLLPLHSSCNVDEKGNVTLFFGLSGTGKTTLSTEPKRMLIGDDEHVWTEKGIFNIEGGCYAKCKDLSKDHEPEIFEAIKFGSVLENVVLDQTNMVVDYKDVSITENTRCAYPLEYIKNVKIPALVNQQPNNIIFLTCDAFGALPPVSMLNTYQAIYHFVSGYTTKMVGTEIGVTKPTATFSACYAGPFLALSPLKYAELLFEKLTQNMESNNNNNNNSNNNNNKLLDCAKGESSVSGDHHDHDLKDGKKDCKDELENKGGDFDDDDQTLKKDKDDLDQLGHLDKLEKEKEKKETKDKDDHLMYNPEIRVWLLNTGWIGGSCESDKGRRIPLKYSRRIVDAINNNEMSKNLEDYEELPYFGVLVPKKVEGVPENILNQKMSWESEQEYMEQVEVVAKKFIKNFNQYRSKANSIILRGEPKLN